MAVLPKAHPNLGVAGSVEDIGVDSDLFGSSLDHGGGFDAELVISRTPTGLEIDHCLISVKGDGRVAAGGSIPSQGVRNAEFVRFSPPPASADCDVDDMVVWLLSLPAVLLVEEHVGVPVGVARDGHGVGAFFNQAEQAVAFRAGREG